MGGYFSSLKVEETKIVDAVDQDDVLVLSADTVERIEGGEETKETKEEVGMKITEIQLQASASNLSSSGFEIFKNDDIVITKKYKKKNKKNKGIKK